MWDDFKEEYKRTKQRLLGFLLRHEYKYTESSNWTIKHFAWMRSLEFKDPTLKMTFEEYLDNIYRLKGKLARIKEKVEEIAQRERYREAVRRLRCLKGVETETALTFVVTIGDFRRFGKASSIMDFVGLVPEEMSSGSKHKQGGITKAGNSHLRKLLIEAAWHYRYYSPHSKRLGDRRKGQPFDVIRYADRGGYRLNSKYHRLIHRGKPAQVAVTSVARELVGFIWGLMVGKIE